MSEEEKNNAGAENNPSDMPQDERAQKREQEIARIMEDIENDRNEKDNLQRFGYFSIPYPAIVGDKAYSRAQEFEHHKVVDGKVITEKRGIYTQPGKKGKGNDVYFERVEPLSDEQVERLKELTKQDKEKLMETVKNRREKKADVQFKPPGPQEITGFYKEPAPEREGTLTIEPDKKRFKGEGGKVITENRGIYTHPTKVGNIPSEYFSFYGVDDNMEEILKQKAIDDHNKKMEDVKFRKENKQFKKPFQPASLKKCDPFYNNEQTYGMYNDEEKDALMNEYKDFKKNGRKKYEKQLAPGAIKHLQPFRPARLVTSGRDGLFAQYTSEGLPEPKEEKKDEMSLREKRELEAKNRRPPFTYNKLMKNSTFSPPISSFNVNLKRDFPSIKFH
jgi:hypothetical protein